MLAKVFSCFYASRNFTDVDSNEDEVQTLSEIGEQSNASTPKHNHQFLERKSNTLMNRSEGGGDSRRIKATEGSLQTRSTRGGSKESPRRGASTNGGAAIKSSRKGGFSLRAGAGSGAGGLQTQASLNSPLSHTRHQQISLHHAHSGPINLGRQDTNSLPVFEETNDNVDWATVANEWALSQALLSRSQLALSATQLRKEITGGWMGSAIGGTMGASRGVMSALSITNEICGLFVDRNGSTLDSNMTTVAFEKKVDSRTLYRFVSGLGPVPVPKKDETKLLPLCRIFRGGSPTVPPGLKHATLTAFWRLETDIPQDESNALGGSGRLLVDTAQASVTIPVMEATEDQLSYYKAHLLKHGDYFRFQTPSNNLPLFTMDIGEKYMQGYLMKKDKGMYLEYHDEPHYHEPLDGDARGQYILAREVGEAPPSADGIKRKTYHVTAFRVPFGTAVYTEPWAIHDDAATIGQWRMGYTIGVAEYSTVVIFNARSQLLGFDFKDATSYPPSSYPPSSSGSSHPPSPHQINQSRSLSSIKPHSTRSSKPYRPSQLSNGGYRPSVEGSHGDYHYDERSTVSISPASSMQWDFDSNNQFARHSDSRGCMIGNEGNGEMARRVHGSDNSRNHLMPNIAAVTMTGSYLVGRGSGDLNRAPSSLSQIPTSAAFGPNSFKRERSSLSLVSRADEKLAHLGPSPEGREPSQRAQSNHQVNDVIEDGEELFRGRDEAQGILREAKESSRGGRMTIAGSQGGLSSRDGGISTAGVDINPSQSSLTQPSFNSTNPTHHSLTQPSFTSTSPAHHYGHRRKVDGNLATRSSRQYGMKSWEQLSPKARAASLGVPYDDDEEDMPRGHSSLPSVSPLLPQKSFKAMMAGGGSSRAGSLNMIDDAEEEIMREIASEEWIQQPPGSVDLSSPSVASSAGEGGSHHGSNLYAIASSSSWVGYNVHGANLPMPLQVTRLRSSLGLHASHPHITPRQ